MLVCVDASAWVLPPAASATIDAVSKDRETQQIMTRDNSLKMEVICEKIPALGTVESSVDEFRNDMLRAI